MASPEIRLRPIGVIRTPYGPDTVCPHQPIDDPRGEARLEVQERYQPGLAQLEKFRYLIVLYHLDRERTDADMLARPPWAGGIEVGLFASRSPHRPCPIAMSVVRLRRIEGNTVFTSLIDAYDGSPLLVIKPYVALLDRKDDANDGWLDDLDNRQHAIDHLCGRPHHHHH